MKPLAAAVALSVACACAATWPVVTAPTQSILCNFVHPDCLSNHWLMVWVAEQVATGGSLLHNDSYYWPVGDAPWLAGNGGEGFAYLPWHYLFGWPLGANVHLVLLLVLNGLSAYALARAAGASPWASVTAAPSGALLVFAIHELGAGRFSQVSVCWLGFFLAAWLSFLQRGGRLRAVGAAVLLALTALFYWYYAFFGVVAGALLLAVYLPRRGLAAGWADLAIFVGTTLVLLAPLLWVFLGNWSSIVGTAEPAFPHPEAAKDSTWPVVPFLTSTGRHAGLALAASACLLALAGVRGRPGIGLVLVAALFAALMAGTLLPGGPFELLYGLASPLRRFWWPYRHVVVLNLALVALGARGLDMLRGGRWWIALPLALSIPLQLEGQRAAWRAQFSAARLPPEPYVALAELPGQLVLEPPLAPGVASAQTPLVYQLFHHKKLIHGHAMWVERVRPPAWEAWVQANSFLMEARRLEMGELDGTFRFDARDLASLRDAGLGAIVINEEYFPLALKELVKSWREVCVALFGPPEIRGPRVTVYDLRGWTGKSEASFTSWQWPEGLRPGGPTLAIQGYRAPSLVFYIPAAR